VRRLRGLLIGYVVIAVLSGWPIALVALASTIASWNNCTLHEGFVNPCIVNGRDIGETLYSMGVMGWFMLATLPLGAVAFIVWTLAWTIWTLRKRRQAEAIAATARFSRDA